MKLTHGSVCTMYDKVVPGEAHKGCTFPHPCNFLPLRHKYLPQHHNIGRDMEISIPTSTVVTRMVHSSSGSSTRGHR